MIPTPRHGGPLAASTRDHRGFAVGCPCSRVLPGAPGDSPALEPLEPPIWGASQRPAKAPGARCGPRWARAPTSALGAVSRRRRAREGARASGRRTVGSCAPALAPSPLATREPATPVLPSAQYAGPERHAGLCCPRDRPRVRSRCRGERRTRARGDRAEPENRDGIALGRRRHGGRWWVDLAGAHPNAKESAGGGGKAITLRGCVLGA